MTQPQLSFGLMRDRQGCSRVTWSRIQDVWARMYSRFM